MVISKFQRKYVFEFFHNLSLHALSISDDSIFLMFDAINKLHKAIAESLSVLNVDCVKDKVDRTFRDNDKFQDIPVQKEPSMNNVVESDIIQAILKDDKIEIPEDDKYQTFPQTPEEIKKEEDENQTFL